MSNSILILGIFFILIGIILIYLNILQFGIILIIAGLVSVIFKNREDKIEQIKK